MYMCICICVYKYMYMYICICIYVYVYVYVCICICIYVYVYVCMYRGERGRASPLTRLRDCINYTNIGKCGYCLSEVSVFGVSFSQTIPSEYDIGHVEFEKQSLENVAYFAPTTGA